MINTLLKGHRAVITGASSGIGEEFARQFAANGVDLVIAARRIDRLEKLAAELRSQYKVQVECVGVDLGEAGATEKLFALATQGGKPVTILVNNAGLGMWGEFLKQDLINLLLEKFSVYRFDLGDASCAMLSVPIISTLN